MAEGRDSLREGGLCEDHCACEPIARRESPPQAVCSCEVFAFVRWRGTRSGGSGACSRHDPGQGSASYRRARVREGARAECGRRPSGTRRRATRASCRASAPPTAAAARWAPRARRAHSRASRALSASPTGSSSASRPAARTAACRHGLQAAVEITASCEMAAPKPLALMAPALAMPAAGSPRSCACSWAALPISSNCWAPAWPAHQAYSTRALVPLSFWTAGAPSGANAVWRQS